MKKSTERFFGIVLRSTYTWGIYVPLIVTCASFFMYLYLAAYVFYYSIIPSIFFGFVQAIWFCSENGKWGSSKDLKVFSVFSGAVFGLLCFPVAFVLFSTHMFWEVFLIFIVLSLLGGAFAGEQNVKNLLLLVSSQKKTMWKKIFTDYFILVFGIALLELILFGRKFWSLVP